VEGSCQHGNAPSGSINIWGSSWVAAQPAASQEGLGSMKLVMSVRNTTLKLYIYIFFVKSARGLFSASLC
jgi:hypothetical protein